MTVTDEVTETINPDKTEAIAAETPQKVKTGRQKTVVTDLSTPEVSEYDTGQHTPSRNLSRGNNGRRTALEIFEAIHKVLSDGEEHSVSNIAEAAGLSYESAFWNLKICEWLVDWPLETKKFRRKKFYRFRRSTRRKRHSQSSPTRTVTEREK